MANQKEQNRERTVLSQLDAADNGKEWTDAEIMTAMLTGQTEGIPYDKLERFQVNLVLARKAADKAAREARREEAKGALAERCDKANIKAAVFSKLTTCLATMMSLSSHEVGILISVYNENPQARGNDE